MGNQSQQVPPQPSATAPKKSRKKLFVGIGALVIVLIIVAAALSAPTSSTIVSSGTVDTIYAGHIEVYKFSLSNQATVSGTVSATNGITIYIMNPTSYAQFNSSGSASSYAYTTGHVSSGTISTVLPAGTYYLVLENTNLVTTSSVTFTSNLVAST